jgi:branched-chain amino acid transport system permease protein
MNLQLIIEQMLNGMVLGSMYALVASGLTLIWGTMKMLNFAHGELYMIGGYVLYYTLLLFGIHPFWGILMAMLIAFALGVLMERTILHPLLDKPGWDVSPIVVTLGVSIFLQNFALKVWGERFKNVPYFIEGTMDLSGFRIAYQRILILVVAAAVMVGFWMYVKRSRFGMALRATAQDREAATFMGIDVDRVIVVTFLAGSALAGAAGLLYGLRFATVDFFMGYLLGIKAFTAAVIGGIGNIRGAMVGGLLLGVLESLGGGFISTKFQGTFAFVILIVLLMVRPQGLFGERAPDRA